MLCGFLATSILHAVNGAAIDSELESAITLYRAEGAEKALSSATWWCGVSVCAIILAVHSRKSGWNSA
jgi:preprotein translocase subunit SecG